MLEVGLNISIPDEEIELTAIRSQGAGGQNVNKVSSAIHLRFDIPASSLLDVYKERLLKRKDKRITREGVLVIKAQQYRTQEKNRQDALQRLQDLIAQATVVPKVRRPTRPSKSSQRKRLDSKKMRSNTKALRSKILDK